MAGVIAAFVAIFAAATAMSGVTAAAIAVFWLRDFDPKYRDTPSLAFELDLWAVLAITLLGAIVVGIAAYVFRKRLSLTVNPASRCLLYGIVYPLVLRFMENAIEAVLGIESLALPVAGWFYLVAFPALGVYFIAAPSSANTHAA